jgi:O-acetyl-ADP-ribose deacetylase (regulator of RNase III)
MKDSEGTPMETKPAHSTGYDFFGRHIEPQLCPIEATGAAVLVNSVERKATFQRGSIAKAILNAAGEGVRQELQAHIPLTPGRIVVTSAGNLCNTSRTRYIFHALVTNKDTHYRADPRLIALITARSVHLADLLEQESIAIPALGSGIGRGNPVEVVKRILNEIIAQLPACNTLKQVIFATTSAQSFALFHNHALADLSLARREQELKDALASFPPSLYGLVGDLLQKLETARQAGNSPEADQLLNEAQGLKYLAEKLQARLPNPDAPAVKVVQLIIATGGSIIHNISQQSAGDHATQINQARDVNIKRE